MYRKFIKRILGFIAALTGSIILIPLWILLVVAIYIDDPGPVFFKQKRFAKDNPDGSKAYFNILKFRSMKVNAPVDVPTHLMMNAEQYTTKIGRILRLYSLDELPQIFNILSGKMALVGPRPALWNQEDLYAERAKYGANAVTPGLTGWAQINGRDEIDIAEKARLDGEYANDVSFKRDIMCLLMTVRKVIKHEGVIDAE